MGKLPGQEGRFELGDVTKEPAYIEVTDGVQSELCVPIISHGQVIGVINSESKKTKRVFRER